MKTATALWSNVNLKRFWITAAVMFIWTFASNMAIHGWWLGDAYNASASLWRSQDEMQRFMGWMWSGQFLTATFFSFIFTKGYEGKGWTEGARYGFLMGLFTASQTFMTFAVTPLPKRIFWAWICAAMIQSVCGGIIASWTYKKRG